MNHEIKDVLINIKEFLLGDDPFTTASVHMALYRNKDDQGTEYLNSEVEIRDCNRKIRLHGDIYTQKDMDKQVKKLSELRGHLDAYIARLESLEFVPSKPSIGT